MSLTPELFRFLADALDDPTTGVNALRASVPRNIADPAPRPVRVSNGADDAWVARGNLGDEATEDEFSLAILPGLDQQLAGDPAQSGNGEDVCPVAVALSGLTTDGDNAGAFAEALRIMRIVRRCILAKFAAYRVDPLILDQQWVQLPLQWTQQTVRPKDGVGAVEVLHVIPFLITDSWALGATD